MYDDLDRSFERIPFRHRRVGVVGAGSPVLRRRGEPRLRVRVRHVAARLVHRGACRLRSRPAVLPDSRPAPCAREATYPDQRYLYLLTLRGGERYRIWGTRGSATRVDLQIYVGNPDLPGSGGRSASFLNVEDITFAGDGAFTIMASPDPADATRGRLDGESGRRHVVPRPRGVTAPGTTGTPVRCTSTASATRWSTKPVLDAPTMAARRCVPRRTASSCMHHRPEDGRTSYMSRLVSTR